MRKFRIALVGVLAVLALTGLFFFALGYFKPKAAGVYIESSPQASVYVDGVQIGRTPVKETLDPGEVVLKLVPESFSTPLVPYETKLDLVGGVETVLRHEFAQNQDEASGEIISFEVLSGKDVGLAIVTEPNSAQISLDGRALGYAPYKTSDLTAGEHQLTVTAQGFKDKDIKVRLQEGYQLTAIIKLAVSGEMPVEEIAEEEIVENKEVQLVRILPTPVGFLRVRRGPSTLETEVGRVVPDKEYILLNEDQDTGWYEIEFEDEEQDATASGWISNQYAQKVENEDL